MEIRRWRYAATLETPSRFTPLPRSRPPSRPPDSRAVRFRPIEGASCDVAIATRAYDDRELVDIFRQVADYLADPPVRAAVSKTTGRNFTL